MLDALALPTKHHQKMYHIFNILKIEQNKFYKMQSFFTEQSHLSSSATYYKGEVKYFTSVWYKSKPCQFISKILPPNLRCDTAKFPQFHLPPSNNSLREAHQPGSGTLTP